MKIVIKQLIILLLIIFTGLGIYFGALLPLAKSQSFINAQRNISTVRSVEDLKNLYDTPLLMWSPIGQEEIVKYTGGTVSDIILGQQIDEPTARWLLNYIEPYLFNNDVRHLMLEGDMYFFVWERYSQNPADLAKAEANYIAAYEIGPKLPLPLYRLVELYAKSGDLEGVRKYGSIILQYWDDPNIKLIIQ